LLGAIIPLGPINTTLSDNFTLNIRWDYLLHALVYLPLPVLIWLFQKKGSFLLDQSSSGSGRFWLLLVLFPLFIASLFEALQLIIPYRSFNINDLFANCMGVIIGFVLLPVLKKFIMRINWD
jgi:VanZ family protein